MLTQIPTHLAIILSSPRCDRAHVGGALIKFLTGAQNVGYKLRIPQRKPWASIEDDVSSAVALAQNTDRLLKGVPADSEAVGRQWIADIREGLRLLQGVVRLHS